MFVLVFDESLHNSDGNGTCVYNANTNGVAPPGADYFHPGGSCTPCGDYFH